MAELYQGFHEFHTFEDDSWKRVFSIAKENPDIDQYFIRVQFADDKTAFWVAESLEEAREIVKEQSAKSQQEFHEHFQEEFAHEERL